MHRLEPLTSGAALVGLVLLLSGCDAGTGPSVTTERVVANIEAPTSVLTNESFQILGTAYGERTDDSRVPVDSIKLFFQGRLTGTSVDGGALTATIDSSMTSVGGVNVVVKAWKTVEEERLSDEVSQEIKVLEAP